MPCGGCGQIRRDMRVAIGRGDIRGVVQNVGRAVALNVDKLRGVDVNAKYGGGSVYKATPYRRPPERT